MKSLRAACAASLIACAAPGSWAAENQTADASTNAPAETIVVRLRLNTEDRGDLFVQRTADGDFLVSVQDLRALGFRDPSGAVRLIDGEPYIGLRSMAGVQFTFQARDLSLAVNAEPQLLSTQQLSGQLPRMRPSGVNSANSSFIANYSLYSQSAVDGGSDLGFTGELAWRQGNFLLQSDASTVPTAAGGQKFVRLLSSLTHDDRDSLRRTVFGDFFTPSREFSTGVALGGLSVSKLYSLNPYFISYPLQSVSGNVGLPSDLEVYLDGQLVRRERLRPGEFELRDLVAYTGARDVRVQLRDSFGRVQQVDYSLYFSDEPLRAGLHEYSYNLGAVRRDYGVQSAAYGRLAASAFHRYGFTDGLTLGLRADASRDFWNAGPMATFILGGAGVASLAAAASSAGSHHGAAALVSYSYQRRDWNVSATLRREWGHFAVLAETPTVLNRRLEGSFSASYLLGRRGTVSLRHSFFTGRDGFVTSRAGAAQPFNLSAQGAQRSTTLSWSFPLVSGRAAMTTSLSHVADERRGSRNEGVVSVTVFLDRGYAISAAARRDPESNSQSLQLSKEQPIGEGLGFIVSSDRSETQGEQSVRLRASTQLNLPRALLRADLGRVRDARGEVTDDHRLTVAGGVGWVDGRWVQGRPITGSFGIAKVGDIPGVGIDVNGQRIGQTNAQGEVFIPTLNPYIDNEVSVVQGTMPIEYSMDSVSRRVAPALRGGAVVDFGVSRLQAFTGRLLAGENGGARPVEFEQIQLGGSLQPNVLQTGRGGEFYLENAQPGSYPASTTVGGKRCTFELKIPSSPDIFVELGEVRCVLQP